MKIHLLPHIIKYYLPWLSTIKVKLNLLLNKKDIYKGKSIKANARYCYSIWLRHISILNENGLNSNPSVVAELGPGDSLGVGLIALLTGSNKYYALDVVNHTNLKQNVKLLDELIDLLLKREDIPNDENSPRVPCLKSYSFPSKIITEGRIVNKLQNKRIRYIKNNLLNYENIDKNSSFIQYFCPWYDQRIIKKESVDMIFSQAVLEHIDNLFETYKAMYFWLKYGGVMSHQIDFKSHGTSGAWNGHWSYSDFEWKILRDKRIYLINREPLSTHIGLLNKIGFKIILVTPVKTYTPKYTDSISRNQLAGRFKKMSKEDFTTCSAHIISMKK